MSGARLVPAAPGWWAQSVIMVDGGKWEFGPKVEVVAWHIEPIMIDHAMEDFITLPVTIYGTIDGNFGIANAPSGKWYSPDVPGAFASAASLAERLRELFDERHKRRRAAAGDNAH